MAFDPKNAVDAAKDIATHAVEKAADIVEDAGHILKGDIAGGVGAIVEDATSIATHAVDKAKEVLSGDTEEKAEEKKDAAE
ncbi:MAG TPA: hypothetical protein PKK01_09515 [Mycobacterium sp.]|nr:MAG: hypothetical protein E6Q56_10310 [Mycobacterium sp.]HOB49536.1 hypothetical protein [Mycobacterium sp.]HPZ95161.1 hypothetical protein [Mycobacterium sp.]HQE15576.1 hypothetical protein [Mycobacterium sp.]